MLSSTRIHGEYSIIIYHDFYLTLYCKKSISKLYSCRRMVFNTFHILTLYESINKAITNEHEEVSLPESKNHSPI